MRTNGSFTLRERRALLKKPETEKVRKKDVFLHGKVILYGLFQLSSSRLTGRIRTAFSPGIMIDIPEAEIRKRLVAWQNYKNILHPQLKLRSERLRTENRQLKAEIVRLKEENALTDEQVEKLRLQLEELQAMKFGKKREKPGERAKPLPIWEEQNDKQGAAKERRAPASYRRPEPAAASVTGHHFDDDFGERNILTEKGFKYVRDQIRNEIKERRENFFFWFGIIGSLTGLVSVIHEFF